MNIFERASRRKLRFDTTSGFLSTEQLWDLPLTAKGERPDLDKVARQISRELREQDEGSFVKQEPNETKIELELQLDIVKHVIESKISDQISATKAVETRQRKEKLLSILASKEEDALKGMSKEEIEAEIAKL